MPKYATGLKILDGFNISIETTNCVQIIATSFAIERSARVRG